MSRDIWFRYIATDTGTLIIDTCAEGDFDTIMAVYTGACGALTLEGCDDDGCPFEGQSRIADLPITAGQELLIRVGGYAPDRGFGILTVDFCPAGEFDLDDYHDFAICRLGPGGGLGIDCGCFDFDHDGDVTLRDFAELQMNFIAAP